MMYVRVSLMAAAAIITWSVVAGAQSSAPAGRQRPHLMAVVSKGLPGVVLFDADSDEEIIGTIPTGSNATHFFAMTSDEKKLFTSNVSAATVSVIDIPSRKLVTTRSAPSMDGSTSPPARDRSACSIPTP